MFLNLAVAVDELELKLLGELLGGGLALDNAIVLLRERDCFSFSKLFLSF